MGYAAASARLYTVERLISARACDQLLGKQDPRVAPVPPVTPKDATLADVSNAGYTGLFTEARPMMVQSLLRHAVAEAISEGFLNCLILTSVADANI